MKTKAIYLTTTLVLTSTSMVFGDSASPELKLRYGNSNGKATLQVSHDISANGRDSMASRSFLMNLELNEIQDTVLVKINKAKGSYTAHGMTQRLPASKLTGQSVTLAKRENGRLLERADPDNDLEIPVGPGHDDLQGRVLAPLGMESLASAACAGMVTANCGHLPKVKSVYS